MKNCSVVLLLLLLLSGCNFTDCFNAEDVDTNLITTKVPMLEKDSQGKKITWHPSNYEIKNGNEITLKVTSAGATLCDLPFQVCSKRDPAQKIEKCTLDVEEGDAIIFRFDNAHQEYVTEAICDNSSKDFYTSNPEVCKKGIIDENGQVKQRPLLGIMYSSPFTHYINKGNVVFFDKPPTTVASTISKVTDFFRDTMDLPLFSQDENQILEKLQKKGFDDIDDGLEKSDDKINFICQNINKSTIFQHITRKISLSKMASICKILCAPGIIEENHMPPIKDCFYSETLVVKTFLDQDGIKVYYSVLNFANLNIFQNNPTNASKTPIATIQDLILNQPIALKDLISSYPMKIDISTNANYNISAKATCYPRTEKSLYYYVGKSIPNLKPGDAGTINIPFSVVNSSNYTISGAPDGMVYFGIKDSASSIPAGDIKIEARVPIKTPDIFSHIVRELRDLILKKFYGSNFGYDSDGKPMITKDVDGAVGLIFKGIIKSKFIMAVKAAMVLAIIVFGISLLIGMLRTPHMDFLILVLKICLILVVFSEKGWIFLTEHLFYWFIYGTSDLINFFSGSFGGGVDFRFIDESLGRFYKYQTWFQILSLLLAGPVGWLVMFIIIFGLIAFFSAMFRAIITYIIAMTLVALLLSISPIFISAILFHKTKAIFDSWIKNLAQITLQPVFIMCTIAFLAQIMNSIMYTLFSYGVCTGCIINLELGNLDPMCVFSFLLPYGFNFLNPVGEHIRNTYNGYSFLGIPISIANVIAFAVLAHAIDKFTEHASTMVTSIFGAFGADISEPSEKVVQSAKSMVGKDDLSMQNKAYQDHEKKKNKSQ